MSGEDKNVDILVKLLKDTRLPDGVSFAGKGLKLNTAEDAKPVVEAIEACDYLVSLNLEGNTIGVEAAEAIAKALEKKPEFKCALWKDMFTGRLKEEIPKALKALCGGVMKAKAQLEVLDLSDNASGPIGVDGISDFIRSPSCYTLKELRLNNMGLGVTGAQMLSDALLECCWRAEKDGKPLELKVFIAGRNRLENEGTKALSCVFKKIESLEELSIPQNGIYHVGIKALSDALYFNRNLKRLNLNDNSPREMGAKALSRALNNVIALKYLDLGDCLIKNSGALAVAEMLHHAHHIEEVVLSFNSIKIDGAFAVIEALKSKKNFTSLKLDGNKFGENGIAKIRTLVDEIWKSKNVLDSLEEDEGSEDDDEDDNDGEEAEEEEEEEDNEEYDDEESGSLYDNGEEISGEEEEDDDDEDDDVKVVENDNNTSRKVTTEEKKTVTVSEFIANPTIGNLMALGKDPADKLVDEIMGKNIDMNSKIEELIAVAMSVSSLKDAARKESINQTQFLEEYQVTLECADMLFSKLFTLALKSNCLSVVNNALPVCLGLIKSENKKSKVFKQESCINTLREAMKKDYFPKETSELLEFVFKETPLLKQKIKEMEKEN